MWNTLRTLVNRTGLTFNALKTSVFFAEDYNEVTENLEYLKERSDIVDTLDGGTEGQILSKNSADDYDFSWQDAPEGGGGGQELYDILVAPTGGDYDLLSSALAVATAGQTIFVKNGTYAEALPLDFYDYALNLTIIGESRAKTIIQLNSVLYGPTGMFLNEKNPTFKNLTFTTSVSNQTLINANCSNIAGIGYHFENCIFETTSTSCRNWFISMNVARESHSMITNCVFRGAPTNGSYAIQINSSGLHFTNNEVYFTSNHSQSDFQLTGEYCIFTGNKIMSKCNNGSYWGGSHSVFSNNVYYGFHDTTNKNMFNIVGSMHNVSNNIFVTRQNGLSATYAIITLGGTGNIFSGNRVGKYENGTYTADTIIKLTGTSCGLLSNVIGKISSGNHVVDTGTGNLDDANLKIT